MWQKGRKRTQVQKSNESFTSIIGAKMMFELQQLWIPSTPLIICQHWENAIIVEVMAKRGLSCVSVFSEEVG